MIVSWTFWLLDCKTLVLDSNLLFSSVFVVLCLFSFLFFSSQFPPLKCSGKAESVFSLPTALCSASLWVLYLPSINQVLINIVAMGRVDI